MRETAIVILWFVALTFALGGAATLLAGEVVQAIIFGVVAYAAWRGIETLTDHSPA